MVGTWLADVEQRIREILEFVEVSLKSRTWSRLVLVVESNNFCVAVVLFGGSFWALISVVEDSVDLSRNSIVADEGFGGKRGLVYPNVLYLLYHHLDDLLLFGEDRFAGVCALGVHPPNVSEETENLTIGR